MKASRGHHDLERRFEGHAEGQGHEEMAGRLETVSESEERQKHVDEEPVSNNAPPQYECYFNNNNNINNNNP